MVMRTRQKTIIDKTYLTYLLMNEAILHATSSKNKNTSGHSINSYFIERRVKNSLSHINKNNVRQNRKNIIFEIDSSYLRVNHLHRQVASPLAHPSFPPPYAFLVSTRSVSDGSRLLERIMKSTL
jgi:hypothetical protein